MDNDRDRLWQRVRLRSAVRIVSGRVVMRLKATTAGSRYSASCGLPRCTVGMEAKRRSAVLGAPPTPRWALLRCGL